MIRRRPYSGNRWTPEQLLRMETLHKAGIKWPAIAIAVGHPKNSCQCMLSRLRADRGAVLAKAEALAALKQQIRLYIPKRTPVPAAKTAAKPAATPPQPAPKPLRVKISNPEFLRATSTAKFQMDAELRARIEILGITGGLQGDPAPGRSALDRKRAST